MLLKCLNHVLKHISSTHEIPDTLNTQTNPVISDSVLREEREKGGGKENFFVFVCLLCFLLVGNCMFVFFRVSLHCLFAVISAVLSLLQQSSSPFHKA